MCVLVDGEVIDAGVLYFRQTMMPPVPPWVEEVRERERERERFEKQLKGGREQWMR